MSVILMSGKKSAQKFKEGNKNKEKQGAEKNAVTAVNSYMPSETVDVWNCVLDGSPVSIAFCKDSLEIWCNDELITPREDFSTNESRLNFELMSRKARITFVMSQKSRLTIDGEEIPLVKFLSSKETGTSSKKYEAK